MTTTIRTTRDLLVGSTSYPRGAVVEVPEDRARRLVLEGAAAYHLPEAPEPAPAAPESRVVTPKGKATRPQS